MPKCKMHTDELDIDIALVRRLIASQCPQWQHLPIEPVRSSGTDNANFRLGQDLAVRLPRRPGAVEALEKELAWLPKLDLPLPLSIPLPLTQGMPDEEYPWRWYVYRWIEGDNAVNAPIDDLDQAAYTIAQFINALHAIDASEGPSPGSHNFNRGERLVNRDAFTRAGITTLNGVFDTQRLTAIWEAALETPFWDRSPVWIHGDLHPGNLLVHQGELRAVIDFGCLGIGDPACDLMVAWNLLSHDHRRVFRDSLNQIDDAAWVRGRAWALSVWVGGIAYYAESHPAFADMARHAITEILTDHVKNG